LEPWEKVLVDSANFSETVHGQIACTDCHGGEQSSNKEVAHVDIIRNPSDDPETFCGECHPDVVATNETSLHNNQAGYWTVINARSAPEDHPALEERSRRSSSPGRNVQQSLLKLSCHVR